MPVIHSLEANIIDLLNEYTEVRYAHGMERYVKHCIASFGNQTIRDAHLDLKVGLNISATLHAGRRTTHDQGNFYTHDCSGGCDCFVLGSNWSSVD